MRYFKKSELPLWAKIFEIGTRHRIFYVISANFDANRRKIKDNFKNRIRFRYMTLVKLSRLHLSGTDIGTRQ